MTLTPRHSLIGFAIALCLGLSGVSCLSCSVIERDRAEARAVRKATLEENVRLALWRMESELAPLVTNESIRPPDQYRTRFDQPAFVRLHFVLDGDRLASPQATKHEDRLSSLKKKVTYGALYERLTKEARVIDEESQQGTVALNSKNPQQLNSGLSNYSTPVQQFKSSAEWGARLKVARQSRGYNQVGNVSGDGMNDGLGVGVLAGPTPAEAMVPLWMGGELILARRVKMGGRSVIQGVWLDWSALEKKLRADIADLLPGADLVGGQSAETSRERVLATLPVKLEPGALPLGPIEMSDGVAEVLVVAWAGIITATAAFGLLLLGAVSLSERRGAFVSAVTHELRTPLTTFRMYTEMLSEGMVEEKKQRKYLNTLRREAIRLGHLVENVLSYAQIEKGRGRAKPEKVRVGELLERFEERLQDRASQVDMIVEVDVAAEFADLMIDVDTSAVEQVLFNLVDNACKYATSAEDRRIHLSARRAGNRAEIVVWDHGVGIDPETKKGLFTPFSKSAHEAANTAPGVGLGLALCRRLARAMNGDLRHDGSYAEGARFLLSFPLCDAG